MGDEPVEFGAQGVLLVQVVQVPGPAAVPALGLPPRRRQAVGPFHAVDVVALQRRVHAVGGVLQGAGDPGPPADPRPVGECLAQRSRRGQPAPDSSGYPAVRVVEGPCLGHQVQDRVLHRGPRQLPGRLPLRPQAPRPVDDHTPDLPATGPAVSRNTNVNRPDRLVDKAVNLGCRLVAERSAGSRAQDGGPQPRLSGEISCERGVGAPLQPLPDPRPEPSVDSSLWPAGVARLLTRDNPRLALELAAPLQAALIFHSLQRESPRPRPPPQPLSCA